MREPMLPIGHALPAYPSSLIQWFVAGFAVLLIAFVIEAIRRGRLKERYALLWLGSASAMVFVAAGRSLLDRVARALGVHYGPSLFFLLALLFLLAILLHFSLVISEYSERTRRLTQSLALLAQDVERLQRETGGTPEEPCAEP